MPGDRVVSGGEDRKLIIWNLKSQEREVTLVGHIGGVRGVKYNPASDRVASAGFDGTVKLWATESHINRGIIARNADIHDLAYSPQNTSMAIGSFSGTLRMEDWLEHRVLSEWVLGDDPIVQLAWNPDGQSIAVQVFNYQEKAGSVLPFDLASETVRWTYPGASKPAFSPDGTQIAVSLPDRVAIIESESEAAIQSFVSQSWGRVSRFSSDGRHLIVGYHDTDIGIWDIATGQRTMTLAGHTQPINDLVITPGKMIISASADRTIRVWDMQSGAFIGEFKGHSESVDRLAITPDGSRLASASMDGTVRIWSLETGDFLLSLSIEGVPQSFGFSHDGSQFECVVFNKQLDDIYAKEGYQWDGLGAAKAHE